MSDFSQLTIHPRTGQPELAEWLDDHYGRHRYGVRFADGSVYREADVSVPIEVEHVDAPEVDELETEQ